jgi:hypothetical protein
VFAIVDLCITVLAFSFARHLRMRRILRATSALIITPSQNETIAALNVNGYRTSHQQFAAGTANQQWQPTQPPPYSQDYPSKHCS